VRESLRGYALGILSLAEKQGKGAQVVDEVRAFSRLLGSQEMLAEVISDPSIPARKRQAILKELLNGKVDTLVLHLLETFVGTENPRAVVETISGLAQILAGDGDLVLSGGFATSGRADGFSQALLESLEGSSDLERVEEDIFRFARIIESYPQVRRALSGVGSVARQRADLASSLVLGKCHLISLEIILFCCSIDRIRDIVEVFDSVALRAAGIRERKIAKVESAAELTKEQISQIAAALERAIGSKVEVRTSVDPSLIGGAVAVVGDTVFDGSVRNRIEQLRVRLGLPATVKSRERI
jgi:F-type H+-transporting ATPase subunit delta